LSTADDGAAAITPRRLSIDPVLEALIGAAVLVAAEWAIVSLVARGEFAGTWEFVDALSGIVPLAWLIVSVGALAGQGALSLARSSAPWARIGLGAYLSLIGVATGIGVTRGRHFAALGVRAAFVTVLAASAFAFAYVVGPRMATAIARAPRRSALVAALLAGACSVVNHVVLPRLYPAFHVGLALITAMTAPVIARGMRGRAADVPWLVPVLVISAFLAAVGTAPRAARALSRIDNLRMIFLDHAPLLSLGVELGACLAPPPPLEVFAAAEGRHTDRLQVDWRERDILLITVDALRADHVGAYGYARPTTPAIDALAREGTLFLQAYCPTPHTSYSVASLMTGKNLHPLLAQGLGADSDTLAGLTRIYGYRTAAFFPPAVFFIDEALFTSFRDRKLDFEYARIEFADPDERVQAMADYLATQPPEQRLFVWVHLFEPHEPYVAHLAHAFGERDIDRYDGEVAFADAGVGRVVRKMRDRRPGTVVIVTADHGEEFGEHRGRYHGTTVYEEQVRVPLVIAGPGVPAERRIAAPVQTIDILPTVLGALDIPRPPRVQGNDLGHFMRGPAAPGERLAGDTPAVAETHDYILLADGSFRLVCARRAGACALYDLRVDPGETHDVSTVNAERFAAMKAALRRIETTQGRYEAASATDAGERPWPLPIRRGLSGDGEATAEIAELLDDSDVRFRRKAAELLFELKRKEAVAPLRLALGRDDDTLVRSYAALALCRLGEPNETAGALLNGPDVDLRRAAALALGENGDARAAPVLIAWWQAERLPYPRAREVLAALGELRPKEAVAPLVASLDDLRLRPYVAETLAKIGQPAARGPLAERFANERHKDTRVALGAALVKLGAQAELAAPLWRFMGTPDPLADGVDWARRSGLLPRMGTTEGDLARLRDSATPVVVQLELPLVESGERPYRLLARAATTDGQTGRVTFTRCTVRVPSAGGIEPVATTLEFSGGPARELFFELPRELVPPAAAGKKARDLCIAVRRSANLSVEGIAVVPLADDLPPPPPEPWEVTPNALAPGPSHAAGTPARH
jgi:arylsulfatase A-like enzyme/HEAT repeat protein